MQDSREKEKSRKYDTIKEHNNFPITDTQKVKISDLPNEEFKIVF